MATHEQLEYYRRREQQSRARAEAADGIAKRIHLEFAERYAAAAQGMVPHAMETA